MKMVAVAAIVMVALIVADRHEPRVGLTIAIFGGVILGTALVLRGARAIQGRRLKVRGKPGHELYVGPAAIKEGAFLVLVGLTFLATSVFFLWAFVTTRQGPIVQ
jgi:hypothetical protein